MPHSAELWVKSSTAFPRSLPRFACAAPRPYGVRDNAPPLRQSLGSFPVAIEANIAAAHNERKFVMYTNIRLEQFGHIGSVKVETRDNRKFARVSVASKSHGKDKTTGEKKGYSHFGVDFPSGTV